MLPEFLREPRELPTATKYRQKYAKIALISVLSKKPKQFIA